MKFIARKKSTGEERIFEFADLYGYEGEISGVILSPLVGSNLSEDGNWVIVYNKERGGGDINSDIEICLVENEPDNIEVPNAETIAAMEEAEKLSHDPNAKTFTSVEELFKDLEADE